MIFYKIRDLLNTQNLHLLYNSLVLPNMMHCHSVWGACNSATLHPLIIMQKKILLIICKKRRLFHTDPLFKQMNILKVQQVIHYTPCNFIYKSLNQLTIFNWFIYHVNDYNTRMSRNGALELHTCRSEQSKKSTMYMGVNL